MSKSKIMAIVIAAVVLIAGVAVAVPMIKNAKEANVPETTTETTTQISTEPVLNSEIPSVTENEVITDAQGNIVTTLQNVVQTVKKTTTTKPGGNGGKPVVNGNGNTGGKVDVTYEDSSDTGIWYVDALDRGLTSMEQQAVLGYSYNSEKGYFYTDDKDCWQYGFGYNEIYDQMAPITVMFIDEVRIRFDYDDRAWMIQLWKGQYGWVFVGAEIGVYTTENFTSSQINENEINHYQCAAQADWLNMDMHVYWDDDRDGKYTYLFSRDYTKYWWATGFWFGTLNRFSSPITELRMTSHITFKDEVMATLFNKGMKKKGFTSASSKDALSYDSIYQSGADVWFDWRSIHDSTYSDYETTAPADKTTTTITVPVRD